MEPHNPIGTMFRNNAILSLRDLVYFTGVKQIDGNAFSSNPNVLYIEIPINVTRINFNSIRDNTKLRWIKLWPSRVITMAGNYCLANTNNCPVYVPDNLVSSYKSAANWSQYASRFHAMSEYTG